MEKSSITPPEGTSSTYYHNKACDTKHELKQIRKQIKALQQTESALIQELNGFLAAKRNNLLFEKKNT